MLCQPPTCLEWGEGRQGAVRQLVPRRPCPDRACDDHQHPWGSMWSELLMAPGSSSPRGGRGWGVELELQHALASVWGRGPGPLPPAVVGNGQPAPWEQHLWNWQGPQPCQTSKGPKALPRPVELGPTIS